MTSRRTFLAGIGAAALAPHALPATPPVPGPCPPPGNGRYVVGVTSNPQLPGAAGELVLKTWLSVAADGTGFGILSDRYGPTFSGHLTVQSTVHNGNSRTWQGIVSRSNEPQLLGQPFQLTAHGNGNAASLELVLLGQTFRGRGLLTG